MKTARFEDLAIWQESTTLTIEIYKISLSGELSKDFGLRDQLRKTVISIPSNIAEGKEYDFFILLKGPPEN
jgi:four helix bundle protein